MGLSIDVKLAISIVQDLDRRMFEAVRDCIQKWTNIIETDAKDNSPVDRGQLQASINNKLWIQSTEILGTIGTNKFYGYYQHEGFKPHWIPFYNPPTWDIDSGVRYPDVIKWAKRHGFNVDGVKGSDGKWIKKPMKGIYVRGTAHPYMKDAYEKNLEGFQKDLTQVVQKAVNQLNGDE